MEDVEGKKEKEREKEEGIVIEEKEVKKKYVVGIKKERELKVIWKIKKGEMRKKIILIMKIEIVIGYLEKDLIMKIMMMGGIYMELEGKEKMVEFFMKNDEEEKREKKGN